MSCYGFDVKQLAGMTLDALEQELVNAMTERIYSVLRRGYVGEPSSG